MTQVSPESQHLVPTVGASVDLGAHLTFRSESMRSRSIQAYRLKEGRPETVPHRPPSTHLWPLSPAFPGINRTPPTQSTRPGNPLSNAVSFLLGGGEGGRRRDTQVFSSTSGSLIPYRRQRSQTILQMWNLSPAEALAVQ